MDANTEEARPVFGEIDIPPGWYMRLDGERPYYVNLTTGATSWVKPCVCGNLPPPPPEPEAIKENTCKGRFVACFIILVSMTCQLLLFSAVICSATSISLMISYIYIDLMGGSMSSFVETFIRIFLITAFAQFSERCQKNIRAWCLPFVRTYLVIYVPCLIHTLLYFLSMTELYLQFKEAHLARPISKSISPSTSTLTLTPEGQSFGPRRDPFRDGIKEGRRPIERWTGIVGGYSDQEQCHTALFLLALSYIFYFNIQVVRRRVIEQLRPIPRKASSLNNFMVTMEFLGIHMVMNILYSIPLIIVAFSVYFYESGGYLTFVQLNTVGVLSGFVFGCVEIKRPWPVVQSVGPYYLYENNARAKAILGQIQVLFVLIFYYLPFNKGQIQEPVTAGNTSVLYFCFAVAFIMLHFTKTNTCATAQAILKLQELQRQEVPHQGDGDVINEEQGGGGDGADNDNALQEVMIQSQGNDPFKDNLKIGTDQENDIVDKNNGNWADLEMRWKALGKDDGYPSVEETGDPNEGLVSKVEVDAFGLPIERDAENNGNPN